MVHDANNPDGCNEFEDKYLGKIVIVKEKKTAPCGILRKARNVQKAWASGVIIVQDSNSNVWGLMDGKDPAIEIWGVTITNVGNKALGNGHRVWVESLYNGTSHCVDPEDSSTQGNEPLSRDDEIRLPP